MPFLIRPFRRFPVQCAVTYHMTPFLRLCLAYGLAFWSLITLLVLSSSPAYAEWVRVITTSNEVTTYADPGTIRRNGDLVKMWNLFDEKTVHTFDGASYLSTKVQEEYDCAEERHRIVASTFLSGNMGTGKPIFSSSDYKTKWAPVQPGSTGELLFKIACGKQFNNAPSGATESGRMDRVDGYGGYKFGMTLKEADAVRADDVVNTGCDFSSETEACIERKTNLFGEEAIIIALVSSKTHTVKQVNISFDRTKSATPDACKNVISNILEPLLETFGTNFKRKGRELTWHLPRGGTIHLIDLCVNDDKGYVGISYRPSDAFQ